MYSEYLYLNVDGADIFTVLLRPERDGKYPTVIMRSPYVDKFENVSEEDVTAEYARAFEGWMKRGYAFVLQHCRGRGKSGGDCIPYVNERRDGLFLQDWIRKQPFYDGTLLLKGNSYLTSVHYATAPFAPDIKGAVFSVQDTERYRVCYRNGFLKKGLHGRWYMKMYKAKSHLDKKDVSWDLLPFSGFSEAMLGEKAEDFDEMIRHPNPDDPFWRTLWGGSDARGALRNTHVPVLLSTAMYDIYTGAICSVWHDMAPEVRARSAFLISAFDHGDHPESSPIEFPDGTRSGHFGKGYEADWFDYVLGRRKEPPFPTGQATYYRMFENRWASGDLTAGYRMTVPLGTDTVTYTYDPSDAPCFKGGLSDNFGGAAIQDPAGWRPDVISVYTAPFAADTHVTGQMTAHLTVRSDCPDTCFYVRVSIEKPEGDFGLRGDITSLVYQLGDYVPGETVGLDFTMDEAAFLIRKGERLRIDVASAENTNFLRHTNRRGLYSEQTGYDVAHNTVVLNESTLTLPVE